MAIPHSLPRRLLTAGTLLFITSTLYSQDVLWEKSYGGKHDEYLMDAVPTADYGFILAGSSQSAKSGNKTSGNAGNLDYWIWKMDEFGEMEWQKSFGGEGQEFLQSIKLTKDGGFFIAGHSNSGIGKVKLDSCRGSEDFWVIKLNAGGGQQWQRTIGGTGQDKLNTAIQTKDGGYLLGGSSDSRQSGEKRSKGFGSLDYWVVKLDKDGNEKWQQTFGGIYSDELRSIVQTNDGGYLVGGYSNSPSSGTKLGENKGTGDFWIIKLDEKGNEVWQKTVGGDGDDQLYTLLHTNDGGFIAGGSSNSEPSYEKTHSNVSGTDYWLIKFDTDGTIVWQETYDFGKIDMLMSITENKDHTLLVGGYSKSEAVNGKDKKGINDYIALKLSEKGEILWDKIIGSDGEDTLRKLVETRDGGYLLAGTSNPNQINSNISHNKIGSKLGNSIAAGNQTNDNLKSTTDNVNSEIIESISEVNNTINEEAKKLAGAVNDKAGSSKDSSLQYGLNAPQGNSINAPSIGNDSNATGGLIPGGLGNGSKKPTLPPSRDKQNNFGNADFWVVKLRDKDKQTTTKAAIEAFPNPSDGYANVIVGYEYESGTATVIDLAGHTLQQFEIHGRTIPVDLSGYPQGVYLINIRTNVQNNGVKVIKTGN